MKKLSYILFGVAALGLASCSNEEALSNGNNGGTANVTISIDIPQIATRSYSDGKTATQLQYAVYYVNADGSLSILPAHTHSTAAGAANGAESINLEKQVAFQLVTGRSYGFVFWASKADAPYNVTFSESGASLNVDYTSPKITANNEALDAFYVYKSIKVEGDTQETFILNRPFAQINVGASDMNEALKSGFTAGNSHIKVSDVYGSLNLINGEVTNKQQNGVDFTYAAIPAKYDATAQTGEKFPVDGYDYLAMAYVLVPKEQQTVEITFDATDANSRENAASRNVGSVPVQGNYRTNIYGKLFTSKVDVNVKIEPNYIDPDYTKDLDNQ